MPVNKKTARITGFLFLLPLLSYGAGNGMIHSVIEHKDYLSYTAAHSPQMIIGAMLMLINSITVATLGSMLFPVVYPFNKYVAVGYLGARILESVILVVGLIGLLSILTISQESLDPVNHSFMGFEVMGAIAKKTSFFSYQIAMIFLGVGSIGFCYVLFRTKLIPAFIALWGMAGYILLLAGALLELFGFGVGILLSLPGGLFEIVLGIWLLVKGFRVPAFMK